MQNNMGSIDQKHSNSLMLPNDENDDWTKINEWLKTEFQWKGRDFTFSESLTKKLLRLIYRIATKFMCHDCLEAPVVETFSESLKALRLYVTNEGVAAYLAEEPLFYEIFISLMMCLLTKKNGPELYTKYMLQFFINLLSVGSEKQKKHMRQSIFEHNLVKNFNSFFCNRYGHFYEISALLYNLYYDVEIEDISLIEHILQSHADKEKTNEYLDFLLEKIISHHIVWYHCEQMVSSSRLELLNCLWEIFIQCNSDNIIIKVERLPEAGLQYLVNIFNESSSIVFQVTQQGDSTAVEEVSRAIELLAHLSSDEKYLPFLQNDKDILIHAGVLLIHVHRLGKASNSVFSPVQKLSEIQNPSEDVRRNPVFGFKADLVRLIGNLCWKNKKMQDLAREGELIPVLLDCCNIDAKNPFIIQWVILAIRNICENNPGNQAVIGGLTQRGVVSSEVLQEFGLTLHAEEDLSIGIIQLDVNKQV